MAGRPGRCRTIRCCRGTCAPPPCPPATIWCSAGTCFSPMTTCAYRSFPPPGRPVFTGIQRVTRPSTSPARVGGIRVRLRHDRRRFRGLRRGAARDHSPLAAGRSRRERADDRGERPHQAAAALPVRRRAVPGACPLQRARPARARRPAARGRAGRAGHRPHPGRPDPADLCPPPVRRGGLGRVPVPLCVQHRRLRAGAEAHPRAAAGAPDVRRAELRDLLVLPAPARFRPRGRPDPLQPSQRGLRRDDVLRRGRLHRAQRAPG